MIDYVKVWLRPNLYLVVLVQTPRNLHRKVVVYKKNKKLRFNISLQTEVKYSEFIFNRRSLLFLTWHFSKAVFWTGLFTPS